MATTNNITTTYAGEKRAGFISAALLSSKTLDSGYVDIRPNIKYKEVLQKIEVSDLLKDATCDFDASGTITHTERILEPKYLQVNKQLCKSDYVNTWEALSLGFSAHHNVPSAFADYLVGHVAASVAEANETNIWSGADANSGEFDGFETILASNSAQPTGQEVAGVTLTKANIVAQTETLIDAIPSTVWGDSDLGIYIGTKALKFYIQSQAALGYLDKYNVDQTAYNFQGIPLLHCPGMSDDVMIAAKKSDLVFGTGLLSDRNEVKVIDMADIDGSQNVRIVMRLSAGVQYMNGEDITTYGITNTAN